MDYYIAVKNQQNTVWNNMGKSHKWNKKKKGKYKRALTVWLRFYNL